MLPKSIQAVKLLAMTPLQQPRRYPTPCGGRRFSLGDVTAGFPPAATLSSLLQLFSQVPPGTRCVLGRFSHTISSFLPIPYLSHQFGREGVYRNCGGSAFTRCFNRLVLSILNDAVVSSMQRSQQKIYRVAFFGPCRIATPQDVPA